MTKYIVASKTELLEVDVELSRSELCSACGLDREVFDDFVSEGIVEPLASEREAQARLYGGMSVRRAHIALRLQRDLGVNTAGAALALELLDELRALRQRAK